MKDKFRNILFMISASMLLLATVLTFSSFEYAPYLFAVAAAGITVSRLTRRYEGSNLRLKRLYRIEKIASLLLLVVSYMLFKNESGWIIFLTIYALLQLYVSMVIPPEEKKEK